MMILTNWRQRKSSNELGAEMNMLSGKALWNVITKTYRRNDPPRKCADCDHPAEIAHKRCPECDWNHQQREKQLRKNTTAMKKRLIKQRGSMCQHCGERTKLEMHHILPVAKGGTTTAENLLLLCKPCHRVADRERLR